MIIHVNGNLLEAEENLILHQVNCSNAMNSGVAKQIRDKWEVVYNKYSELCSKHSPEMLLGVSQFVAVNKQQVVVNLFGQQTYGYSGERYTNYEALYKSLERTAKKAKQYGLSVALPYNIGCDRGGGDWSIVYAMIESLFKDHDRIVAIYNFNPNQKPLEDQPFIPDYEYKPAFIKESSTQNFN